MPHRWLLMICGVVASALAMGCHAPAQPEEPTVARVTAETPEDYDRLWEAAAKTLRHRFFRLDRQDRGEGIITTHPETTANWFEFWRPQPEPSYYWWEANVGTVDRQATVKLQPVGGSAYEVNVEIERRRFSLPERQVDSAAGALRLYSANVPTTEGRMEKPSEHSHWIPLGRDALLEQRVLAAIIRRYSTAAVNDAGEGKELRASARAASPVTQNLSP